MRELIGKKIKSAYISADHTTLGFLLEDGEKLVYYTVGDCCSISWVEHCSNSDSLALKSGKVIDIQQLNVGTVSNDEAYEVIQCYGVTLSFEYGAAFEFEFRNSSNGYYSGWIERRESFNDNEWDNLNKFVDF